MTPATCPTCGATLAADAPAGACARCLLQAGFPTGGETRAERAPTPEELAPKFPGLVIEELLGRGGMGVVYRARHKALDREVALKVLPERVGDDKAFGDRFQREARALAKLQHPNIVGVHDFGRTDGLFWLVMEFVDGLNIRQAMKAGQIGPREALAIVPQICDALQYAHEHGVVHRDIKPENVLLDKSGRVKVADFGLAKLMEHGPADAALTGAGQVMGTPHYMAPEQWEKPTTVDHRADIYSLGVVFYEMLTGELPLGRFDPPSSKVRVDVRLDEVVLRSLEKAPERRYQHVVEVKTDVGRLGDAPPAPAPTPSARLSKLAVAGALAVPVTAAALLAVAPIPFSSAAKAALAALCVATGCVVSVVAWVRIHRAQGRLKGVPWAAVGTFLPLVASCLLAPLVWLGTTKGQAALEDAKRRVQDSTYPASADDRRGIAAKWSRLVALGPDPAFEDVLSLYDHGDRPRLSAMSADERREKARNGEIGLPLLPSERLPRALKEYELADVQVDVAARRATAVARAGDAEIRFAMARSDDKWDFAAAPVEVVAPTSSSTADATALDDNKEIDALWQRLRAAHASMTFEKAERFYDPTVYANLKSGPPELRRVGLPLADEALLGGPLRDFTQLQATIADDRRSAHAVATSADGRVLKFDLLRSDAAGWRFSTAFVRR